MLPRLRQWSDLAAARLPTLLPSSCALCGAEDGLPLCTSCRQRFLQRAMQRCPRCGIAHGAQPKKGDCASCTTTTPAFDASVAAVDYAAPLDQLVLTLKFGARLELAPLFAQMLEDAVRAADTELPEMLLPVPLGPRRLVERGFNQALEIARPLGARLGLPVRRDLAWRTRDTDTQSLLHPDQRRRNVADAFSLRPGGSQQVQGRHVGVVDDVMTTGETLNAMAATLKRFGAARVTNFVFARTLPH